MEIFNSLKFLIIPFLFFSQAFSMQNVQSFENAMKQKRDQELEQRALALRFLDNLSEDFLSQSPTKENIINLLAHLKTQMLMTFFCIMHLAYTTDDYGYIRFSFYINDKINDLFDRQEVQFFYALDYVDRLIEYVSKNFDKSVDFYFFPSHLVSILLLSIGNYFALSDGEVEFINKLKESSYSIDRSHCGNNTFFIFGNIIDSENAEIKKNNFNDVINVVKINMKLLPPLVELLKFNHTKKQLNTVMGRKVYLCSYPTKKVSLYFDVKRFFMLNSINEESLKDLDILFYNKPRRFVFCNYYKILYTSEHSRITERFDREESFREFKKRHNLPSTYASLDLDMKKFKV